MKKLGLVLCLVLVCLFAFGRKTKVEFWTISLSPTFDNYINSIIESYEEKNPNIEIEWSDVPYSAFMQKITASIAAGNAPDVINLNSEWMLDLVGMEALSPIDDYISKVEKYRYLENLWEVGMVDGKTYSVPWYTTPNVLIYNKELFEKSGLDPDTPPTTWEEVEEYCEKIKQNTDAYPLSTVTDGHQLLLTNGIPLVTKDGKKSAFNNSEALELLEYYNRLYKKGYLPKDLGDYSSAVQRFSGNNLGMFVVGISQLKSIKQNNPSMVEKIGVSQLPLGKAKIIPVTPMNFTVPYNSKRKEEAVDFILWVTSGYWQVQFAKYATVLPSTKISLDSDPYFKSMEDKDILIKGEIVGAKSLKYGTDLNTLHNIPADKYNSFRRTLNENYFIKAIKNEIEPEEALKLAEIDCNKILAN
ncbi:ABC transporter substrate-binding protein [Oceanotoga teriensis]|uniref:ABC transporter substrate-binding protein n=1 Tax=Oceanotoga teriensis TaxID=515440 RepID=UPI002713812C|nr:sugar ABC transporter substrate-binding protein [Oceanotoga teriensis]MDO7976618.1 sugar ABC transporter substrate-binding protein [Oceanotoga teriensis]